MSRPASATRRAGVESLLELYRRADAAERVAEQAGGNTERGFDPAMSDAAFAVAEIEVSAAELVRVGCFRGPGYLFSRTVPAEQLEAVMPAGTVSFVR